MKFRAPERKFILVHLILRFNLALSLILVLTQIFLMDKSVNSDGLVSRRFLHRPLLNILEGKKDYVPPRWLGMVVLQSEKIAYIADKSVLENIASEPTQQERLNALLSRIVNTIPEEITIVSFTYKGKNGMAIYLHDALPIYMRILQKPHYIILLFTTAMLLFFLGILEMSRHQRGVNSLVNASERIQSGDLDTKIINRHHSALNNVFKAFDQLRRTLKDNRDKDSRFIMSVTHDLKTPLAAMRMYLEAMKDGYIEISDEARTAVEKVLIKSSVLESRIGELLEYSRLLNQTRQMERQSFEAASWLKDQSELFDEECRFNRRGYQSELSVPPTVFISGNRAMLERALQNLIDNACRYTSEGDSIYFSASPGRQTLNITVEDSGPGISEKNRERIFDLFYREDKGRNSRGMGIGLASVRSIIESHGGSITCSDSEKKGARFQIELPLDTEYN